MPTPPLHSSSLLDTLPPTFQTATCSAPVTTSTSSEDTAYPTLSDTCYSSKGDSDHHSHMTPDISTMPFLPELLLSSLLQTQCNLPQPPIIIQPIHHTLENATITYDTLIEQQKELVKDVFFSPAMSATTNSTLSSSISSTSSSTTSLTALSLSAPSPSTLLSYSPLSRTATTPLLTVSSSLPSDDDTTTLCGSQTDGESTRSLEDDDFSPSDLLLDHDDSTLFFGALDLDLEHQPQPAEQPLSSTLASASTSTSTSPSSSSLAESSIGLLHQSPVLKRKRKGTAHTKTNNKDSWLTGLSPKSTPPMSPNEYGWDYFDASGEDSSSSDDDDDNDSASSSLDYRTMKTDFKYISVQDDLLDSDDDSISSWENRRATMFDDTSDKIHTNRINATLVLKTAKPINKTDKKKHRSKQTISITNTAPVKKHKLPKKVKVASKSVAPVLVESHDHLEKVDPRPTCHPTLYQKLTKANVDWCRYCGTTEGVNWRPGPWGKRTLCNKHGCDYKGYGFACKLPRLDLTGYVHESLHDRDRPVLQFYCAACHRMESWKTNVLVRCEGCYKAHHQKCYQGHGQALSDAFVASDQPWYCDDECRDNVARRRVVVEISRKRLPLMCAPTKNQAQASLCSNIAMASDLNNNNNNTSSLLHLPSFTNRATRGNSGGAK
ncbi:hypothetical protein [Absidia glauca]|uniref:Zinc finger PHD-type domain-containing protein n=1 Tax=Absidia glauca TaxID=4829 RepID=A0A163M8M2_ABSGL|nr:hypothetical protein [Absidia glauca]